MQELNSNNYLGVSKSLKIFCENNQDIIGMVAYALFKQSQTSWALSHNPTEEEVRKFSQNIPPELKDAFEERATTILSEYIEEFKTEWENEERENLRHEIYMQVAESINKNTDDKYKLLKKNTSLFSNTLSNVIATFIVGIASFLVLIFYISPNLSSEIAKKIVEQAAPQTQQKP